MVIGRVDRVDAFRKPLRSCATRQYVPINLPSGLFLQLERGKGTHVTIDSVERTPSKADTWNIDKPDGVLEWTWRDVAAWIDTEGSITVSGQNICNLTMVQKDRNVLQGLCAFLNANGISPKLIRRECRHLSSAGVWSRPDSWSYQTCGGEHKDRQQEEGNRRVQRNADGIQIKAAPSNERRWANPGTTANLLIAGLGSFFRGPRAFYQLHIGNVQCHGHLVRRVQ